MRRPGGRRPTVVVFAKAPRLGAVKTRLAGDIGAPAAWRFHRLTLAATLRRLGRDRRWRTVLALTPDRLASRPPRLGAGLAVLPQGPGDIGQRMARLLARFQPGPVLLVGGDLPTLGAAELADASRRLAAAHVVFGPATDGGYWLVGVRGRRPPGPLFRRVRWSCPETLADSLARLRRGERLALAATLADVDTGADLARLRRRSATGRPPAPRARAAGASARRSCTAGGGCRAGP